MPSSEGPLGADDVRRAASRRILEEFGHRLWAGEPAYDERQQRWTVPIHSRALPDQAVLGELTIAPRGNVLHAPSRQQVQDRAAEIRRDVPLQRVEEYLWDGVEWVRQAIMQAPLRLQALTGAPSLHVALGDPARPKAL